MLEYFLNMKILLRFRNFMHEKCKFDILFNYGIKMSDSL